MKPLSHIPSRQRGLSLIESLVALVLTLVLIAGVTQMLFGTQRNIRNQNDRSSMDDSARFAVEYISRAGYRAGYKRNLDDSDSDVFLPVPGSFPIGASVFGTDTELRVRYQGHTDSRLAHCHNGAAALDGNFIEIWSLNGTDLRCELTRPGGAAPTAEPLMSNVEAVQFQYGEDTNNDRYPDIYRNAASVANWANVRSVVVSLRMVSDNDNLAETPQPYLDFAGNSVTPADRRLRRNVFTTVALRNLLP